MADSWPTVFIMLRTKVSADSWPIVGHLLVTCRQCVGKLCAEMIANSYLFIASTTTSKQEKLIEER